MNYKFAQKEPDKAYVSNRLWLPKSSVRENQIHHALEFFVNGKDGQELLRLWEDSQFHVVCPREFLPPSQYPLYKFPFVDLRCQFDTVEFEDCVVPRNEDQERAWAAFAANDNGILNLGCGHGKALAHGQTVLTARGHIPIEQITTEDLVAGTDGRFYPVLGVFPQGERDIYRVSFTDRSYLDCDANHLWTLIPRRAKDRTAVTLTTKELPLRISSGRRLYLPTISPVEWAKTDIKIDPYTLGALLGDGHLSRPNRVEFTTADEEMFQLMKLPEKHRHILVPGRCSGKATTYSLAPSRSDSHKCERLPKILGGLGLMGHTAHSKFVPTSYKFGSVKDRLALLQGLFDTDGSPTPWGAAEYATVSEQLALDVTDMVLSLGGTCTWQHRTTKCNNKEFPSIRLLVKLPEGMPLFRLCRKLKKLPDSRQREPYRAVDSVTYIGKGLATCISVSSPDHLFLAGSYIPTHNTKLALKKIAQKKVPTLIIVPDGGILSQWVEAIEGSKDTPVGLRFKGSIGFVAEGKFDWEEHPIVIALISTLALKIRDGKVPEEFFRRFGLVIYDEVHRLGAPVFSLTATPFYGDRIGLSVGPSSICELKGGPFGQGWVGEIQNAYAALDWSHLEREGEYEVLRIKKLGIMARGWTGTKFGWKRVESFIRHPCDQEMRVLKAAGNFLELTKDHSLYRVENGAFKYINRRRKFYPVFQKRKTEEIEVGDILPIDDGYRWEGKEKPFDFIKFLANRPGRGVEVAVDLSDITREKINATPREWWRYRNQGKYGHRLPLEVFIEHRSVLPSPTRIYWQAGNGGWCDPIFNLSDWAYWLGFWLGDGWVSKKNGSISFSVDNPRVRGLRSQLEKTPHLFWTPKVSARYKGCKEIAVNNKAVREFLISTFQRARCFDKWIPGEWIISWPKKARMELLRGLSDSDSHKSERETKRGSYYTTTSSGLAKSLLSLLRSIGVMGGCHITSSTGGGIVNGRKIKGRHTRYTIFWSLHAEEGNHKGRKGNRNHFIHENLRFREAPVREINNSKKPPYVYDLEMEGHPSFVVNGILVHNTATVQREDGLDPIYRYHLGEPFYSDLSQDLTPRIYFWRTPAEHKFEECRKRGTINISLLRTMLGRDYTGNVYRYYAIQDALKEGRKILCLSHSKDQLQLFHALFPDSGLLLGATPQKERMNILRANQLVFAIAKLGSEGVDDPRLDTLFWLTPFRSKISLQQSMGRILRAFTGKMTPVMVVFEDHLTPPLRNLCHRLRSNLRLWGFHLETISPKKFPPKLPQELEYAYAAAFAELPERP